jgi:hypothetical protein
MYFFNLYMISLEYEICIIVNLIYFQVTLSPLLIILVFCPIPYDIAII